MPYAASSKCSITWKIQTSKVKAWDFGWIRKQPPQTKSTAFYWNNTKLRPTPRSFQFFLSMERVSCSSCRVRAMIFGHHKKCIPAPSEVEAMLPEKDRNEMNFLLKIDLVSRCSNEPFWSFAHKGVRKTSVSEVNQSGPCPWCWASAHPGCDTCARSEWNPVRSHFAWHRLPSTPGAAALHVGFWGRSAYFSNILHKACSGCLIFRYAFFGSCPSMSHPKRHPRYHTWTSLQHPLQPIGDVTSNKSLKRESNVWINDLAWENG